MATIVGDIAISVGADIGPLVTDLARGQAAVSRFGSSAQASATGGMRAFATAAGMIAGAATAAGLGLLALTRRSMESIDAVSKSARMLGIHTASLQAMAQVANGAGVETDALSKAIIKMQNNIDGLSQGTAAQVAAFERLGLGVGDLIGLSADEQFARIGEAINGIEEPAARTAAALDIFGKAGAELITIFDGYRGAVADAAKFQRDFNIAVSDVDGQQIEAANDAVGRLQVAFSGLGTVLAVEFAPAIAAAVESLTDLINISDAEINAAALSLTFDRMDESLSAVKESAQLTAATFTDLADGAVSSALTAQVASIEAAQKAFDDGAISADEYKAQVAAAVESIQLLYAQITLVGGVDMSDATREIGLLEKAIDLAFGAAQRLAGAMPGGAVPLMHPKSTPVTRNKGGDMMFPPVSGLGAGPGGLGTLPSGLGMAPVAVEESNAGGGGGGRSLADELEAMRASFQSQAELAEEQYQDQLARLREFREAKLLAEEEYNAMEAQLKADHEASMAAMEQQAMQVKIEALSGMFGDLGSLMQSHNEKMFKVGKAASVAKAIVDGYEAATAAWKKGMQIGGPGMAAAFAGASMLRTASMIQGINQTRIGGGTSQTGGGGAGASAASAPASPLEVRLTGFGPSDLISGGMIGGLLDKLSAEAGDRGYKIMVAA